MENINKQMKFSFKYNGTSSSEIEYKKAVSEKNGEIITEYSFDNGITVTNHFKKYEKFGVFEWYNEIENTSNENSGIISELFDCDIELPMEHEDDRKWEAYYPDTKTSTKVYAPTGSTWTCDEFYCDVDKIVENKRVNHLYPNWENEYKTKGGRSSVDYAPFFNVYKNNGGYIFAIGWTGQWNAKIKRLNDSVIFKSGIEDVNCYLLPGEKLKTSSIVIMPYDCGFEGAQNKWRKFLKEEISPLYKTEEKGLFCAGIWGGMKSELVIERINKIVENKLPFEYIWMDAGWYGEDTLPTPDEFEGDWPEHTGDWTVSKKIHPNQLKDVSKLAHDNNMKFLLWYEPERVIKGTPITKTHPEYFIELSDKEKNLMLDLGNEEARDYNFNFISNAISETGIDCYRQHFNYEPFEYWRKNDEPGRSGITEIKYINGMYEFLDKLLEKFPSLIIDNCASGGRRIDIEMYKRSVPLWRSDYQCPANYDSYSVQCHSLNYSNWLPYSGTGCGRIYDLYRLRSSYSPCLTTNFTFSARNEFGNDLKEIEFLKKVSNEYLMLRPYFSEDYYQLTKFSNQTDVWCAMQFDRPEKNDGIVQVFRRDDSPYEVSTLKFHVTNENATYKFTDIDNNEVIEISGKELKEKGLKITITEKRTAKVYIYNY